jgi:hypothetical protein
LTSESSSASININGQDIGYSSFYGCGMSGLISGSDAPTYFNNCSVNKISNFNGTMKECVINGKMCFQSGSHTLAYCTAGLDGAELCTEGFNTNLIIRNWSGPLTLTSGQHPSGNIVIDSFSSVIVLDESMTEGTITLYGVGDVVNNMTGNNVVLNTNLLQSEQQTRIERKIDDLTALSL